MKKTKKKKHYADNNAGYYINKTLMYLPIQRVIEAVNQPKAHSQIFEN